MARPKKKPEYDSDQMAQQLMEAVTDAYLNPPQGTEDDTGHTCWAFSHLSKKRQLFSKHYIKMSEHHGARICCC